jgi:hypothetical protein
VDCKCSLHCLIDQQNKWNKSFIGHHSKDSQVVMEIKGVTDNGVFFSQMRCMLSPLKTSMMSLLASNLTTASFWVAPKVFTP